MFGLLLNMCPKSLHLVSRIWSDSRADKHINCALFEEGMKSLGVLVHTISFNFRCGGKLDLTSEVGHLGFYKMAAVQSLFSKSQLVGRPFYKNIGLDTKIKTLD